MYDGEQIPRYYFPHVQDDLNLHIVYMFEGTFLLDTAHMCAIKTNIIPATKCTDPNQSAEFS